MVEVRKIVLTLIFVLIWGTLSSIAQAEENLLISFKDDDLNLKPDKILQEADIFGSGSDLSNKAEPYQLSNNHFISNKIQDTKLFKPKHVVSGNSRLIKIEIEKSTTLYDEITLDDKDTFGNEMGDLNDFLATKDPCSSIQPMVFKEKPISPFVNRAKTVYFLTALSSMIGQSGQIEDAFSYGTRLTGGGRSKGDQYGYNNVGRNFLNPFSRAIKGAKIDDSGPIVNYIQHPMFGFGVASYLTASGASPKEVFLVTLADNFLFEYVVEGTYVAPSGIDLLATTGGCIAGYLATRYIFKKPFKAFLDKTSYLKEKYNVSFYPIIEPGYTGSGMRVGSRITFRH